MLGSDDVLDASASNTSSMSSKPRVQFNIDTENFLASGGGAFSLHHVKSYKNTFMDAHNEQETKALMDAHNAELSSIAERVINRVGKKLNGTDFGDSFLDVEEQVDRLIREASDHNNISQMFMGWCGFW